jgi:hypothetical protein
MPVALEPLDAFDVNAVAVTQHLSLFLTVSNRPPITLIARILSGSTLQLPV